MLFWLKKPSPKMEVAPQNGLRSPISRETHSIANQPHRPETQAPNKGPLGDLSLFYSNKKTEDQKDDR